ncbi:MAG: hypothetical protein JXJ04_13895 [Spirochaetales bacterium]|nr:hypothetical protein [Spirochaetales bacterium]
MKIIFISYDLYLKEIFEFHFKPLGFEITHHKDPVQVIADLHHTDVDVIIYYERDYPRHWKPMLKVLRDSKSKREVVFILITHKNFPFEEAAKAIHLMSNAIITDNIYNNRVIFRLEEILRRYFPSLPDSRRSNRYPVEESDKISFLFTHPDQLILITGRVLDISVEGLRFYPKAPQRTQNLKQGRTIPNCSLLLGEQLIAVYCEVIQNSQFIGFRFTYFQETQSSENVNIRNYIFKERYVRKIEYHVRKRLKILSE